MKRNVNLNEQTNGNGTVDQTEPGRPAADAIKKTRILIVEDEPAMVAGLRDNFEYEGYEVISAADGAAGLERAIADNPDYADAHFNLAVIYATALPPAKELAKRHYARATSLGAEPDASLEKLLH